MDRCAIENSQHFYFNDNGTLCANEVSQHCEGSEIRRVLRSEVGDCCEDIDIVYGRRSDGEHDVLRCKSCGSTVYGNGDLGEIIGKWNLR